MKEVKKMCLVSSGIQEMAWLGSSEDDVRLRGVPMTKMGETESVQLVPRKSRPFASSVCK